LGAILQGFFAMAAKDYAVQSIAYFDNVRFGSKADICGATEDVRFSPIATSKAGMWSGHDRFTPESGLVQGKRRFLLRATSGLQLDRKG
jgi:hypothetical protein